MSSGNWQPQQGGPTPFGGPAAPAGSAGGGNRWLWVMAVVSVVIAIVFTTVLITSGLSGDSETSIGPGPTSSGTQSPAVTTTVTVPGEVPESATASGGQHAKPTGEAATTPEASPATSSAPTTAPTLTRVDGATVDVEMADDSVVAMAVGSSLAAHGDYINSEQYDAAWALMTPTQHSRSTSFSQWQSGVATSTWVKLTVKSVSVDGGTATATTQLRTTQDPAFGDGHDCLVWNLTYTMVKADGQWKIDKAKGDSAPC